jgi:hypothetical protein
VNIDDGGGPESVEPAESSAESGEVDDRKGSSMIMPVKGSPPCAGPGVGSVNSEGKLCALEDPGEKPDDSGSDGYIGGLAVP